MPTTRTRLVSHLPPVVLKVARRLLRRAPANDQDALIRYIRASGVFDSAWYLERYPKVAQSGMDPARHYVKYGALEGRKASEFFDTRYYLKAYPDVAKAAVNPLYHFCQHGHRELRNPSADFDSTWYWLRYLAIPESEANPLLHYQLKGKAEGLETRAVGALSATDRQALADVCEQLLEGEKHDPVLFDRLAKAFIFLGRKDLAEQALREVASWDADNPLGYERLARMLARHEKWWQAVEALERATELEPTHADWFYRLGEAREEMSRFDLAAEAYQLAVELDATPADSHYRLGHALEKSGQPEKARESYAQALARDKREKVQRFGVGVLHQKHSYWSEAVESYAKLLVRQPFDAELHYRCGMAQDRLYQWSQAEQLYCKAITLNAGIPYWHYRYGFVMERQGRLREAAEAYDAATQISEKHAPYWYYRRGYVLDRVGDHEQACRAYILVPDSQAALADSWHEQEGVEVAPRVRLDAYLAKVVSEDLIRESIAHDSTRPDCHYRLGEILERKEDWLGATVAYEAAVARSNEHRPAWYHRLGFVLFQAQRFDEACDAFRQTRIIQRAYGIDQVPLEKADLGVRLSTTYAEYLETLPVREHVVMYESHLGKSVSCNPLAIFRELVNDPDYRSWLHVWVVADDSRVPDELRGHSNVVLVHRPSDLFLRYLATAEYFIDNTNLPQYFVRREQQKVLATWHGTPLKTLGKQQQYKFLEHKRSQRNFLQATHIISPNPHTTEVLLDSYDIRHIMGGKLAETGYPRVDLTLNADESRKAVIRRQLGVSGTRPVVLYAPTWRGTLETVSYEVERAQSDLQHLAERHDCDIVFRGHHLLESVLGEGDSMGRIVAPETIDTNELLSVVDVLITDYSSIFFDFMATGRPVIYYIYDLEQYQHERGLYFSMDEMPGYKCADLVSLDDALGHALHAEVPDRAHYNAAQAKFNGHDDGAATRRVIDFFFHGDASHVVDRQSHAPARLLLHGGGFKRNGITTSFLNLTKFIDRSKYHLTVAVSPDGIEKNPECRELFERLPEDVAVIGRHGLVPMTWEERWLRTHYDRGTASYNAEQTTIMRDLYDREYRRVFGHSRFDAAITFSGYDPTWASIFNLNHRTLRKAIYMHSDMREEYAARFPELMRMFRLYGRADRLVSVCEASSRVNREQLSTWLGIPAERFVSSENVQDPARIRELAAEPLPEEDAFVFGDGAVFMHMGRLSVEKDQPKLLRAFAAFSKRHRGVRLVILGTGPLRQSLGELARELGVADRVHFLGYRANPYPYLRYADCFVLSSNHEAKTMSLIESLIVGTPFVATDISGNADIKKMCPRYFFANSEEGLVEGMVRYVDGDLPKPDFDGETYQREAILQFEDRVVNNLASHGTGTPCSTEPQTRVGRMA